ncbi:SdpI family protein [Clostridium sp. D2Q-11]|uniref:SdpI family protein n=1 Tax=Anaeromonas frigoriresistens TaxID=2683708 RepID=A0A942Z8W8_9FIRM|nr:SdpI family protein [Anaeromonas frigoriresistens]MBS4538449.1 SdpI family protein [Anaeromonas frigoriresistens]
MKKDSFLIIIALISLIATFFVYGSLPEEIPRHWGSNGEVDAYWGKEGAFLTAALPLLLYFLMRFLPKIDPKRESYRKHKKAYNITIYGIIVLMIALHWVTMYASLGNDINMKLLVTMGVGILFIIMGNYMGQIRHNYFFGIKNPWTLASEEVWNKTHRVTRYAFILLGLMFIIGAFTPGKITTVLIIGGIIVLVIFTTIYPYLLYRKINDNKK